MVETLAQQYPNSLHPFLWWFSMVFPWFSHGFQDHLCGPAAAGGHLPPRLGSFGGPDARAHAGGAALGAPAGAAV